MRAPARSDVVAMAVFAASAAGVSVLQPGLATTAHGAREVEDVYAFPPPVELHFMTLGWDAAAVDLLWAKLLVEYGTHWTEHREFTDIPKYLDSILELEPAYPPLYKFVDTLLAYRPLRGTAKDVRMARAYLERGLRERPDDARLWTRYGQFLAFVAPSFLEGDALEIAAWRKDGARAMGRAVELGADADRALSAATLLTDQGATQEAIQYLEHAYAFTEHPAMTEVHEAIGRRLAALEASTMATAADTQTRAVDDRWRRELPNVPRAMYLLLGPANDPNRCAGLASRDRPACAPDWSAALGSTEPGADVR